MGWFWGASGNDNGNASPSTEDPLRNLDAELRDFLTKESPVTYGRSNPPASTVPIPASVNHETQGIESSKSETASAQTDADGGPKVPQQSLYKDGRYAHLWKTYQSPAELDAVAKSDQEKINDVLEGYKTRKAEIGRAALENCALEQWQVNECFRSGDWTSRMTMCRKENKELERCYMMQAKFLKALGYLSTFDRPSEVDERIQMHADTLYHRMLDQEAAIETAKAEGRSIPEFPPLLSKTSISKTSPTQLTQPTPTDTEDMASLSPAVQTQLKKRLEGLNDEQRQIEERAIAAEIQAGEQLAGHLGKIYQKQEEERQRRKDQGRETIGDKVASILGFR